MGAFGLVELQGAGDAFEHVFGRAGGVATLQAGVVLDADAGQHGRLFPAQTFHPAGAAIGGQAGLLGADLRSP